MPIWKLHLTYESTSCVRLVWPLVSSFPSSWPPFSSLDFSSALNISTVNDVHQNWFPGPRYECPCSRQSCRDYSLRQSNSDWLDLRWYMGETKLHSWRSILSLSSYVGNTMATFVMQSLGCEVAALNTVQFSASSLPSSIQGIRS